MIKLKYEDVVKLTKYLEANCRMSPVLVKETDLHSGLEFKVTNTKGEKLTIYLYDEKNYMSPRIVTETEL